MVHRGAVPRPSTCRRELSGGAVVRHADGDLELDGCPSRVSLAALVHARTKALILLILLLSLARDDATRGLAIHSQQPNNFSSIFAQDKNAHIQKRKKRSLRIDVSIIKDRVRGLSRASRRSTAVVTSALRNQFSLVTFPLYLNEHEI